jgi:hypothetical protein
MAVNMKIKAAAELMSCLRMMGISSPLENTFDWFFA